MCALLDRLRFGTLLSFIALVLGLLALIRSAVTALRVKLNATAAVACSGFFCFVNHALLDLARHFFIATEFLGVNAASASE